MFVEYAKAGPEDLLIAVTAYNRGDQDAALHLLPTLWFRNRWWNEETPGPHPQLTVAQSGAGSRAGIRAEHAEMGSYLLSCEGEPALLFTDNETNEERSGGKSVSAYTKDAFHRYLLHGETAAINPKQSGTKAAAHYDLKVPARKSVTIRMRLTKDGDAKDGDAKAAAFKDFSSVLALRLKEADDFYRMVLPQHVSDDEKLVMRQAFAGMLWSKQFYHYDLERWLSERHAPEDREEAGLRNLRMVPHADTRRDLHAGQVGVSVVCGVGPGVSYPAALDGRSFVCQDAAEADC